MDPLHAIDGEYVDRTPLIHFQEFFAGHLCADEPSVIGVAGEVSALAVRDGERGSWRNTLPSDVVSEPIQVEERYDNATHATIVAVERQRKLDDVPARRETSREFPDRECAGLQGAGKVGPRGDTDWFATAVRVAERLTIQVSDEKGKECRKSRLHRGEVGIACLAVPRFYRREF